MQFKRGPPLDPVVDFVGIQVVYGIILLVFVLIGTMLGVAIYRKLRGL